MSPSFFRQRILALTTILFAASAGAQEAAKVPSVRELLTHVPVASSRNEKLRSFTFEALHHIEPGEGIRTRGWYQAPDKVSLIMIDEADNTPLLFAGQGKGVVYDALEGRCLPFSYGGIAYFFGLQNKEAITMGAYMQPAKPGSAPTGRIDIDLHSLFDAERSTVTAIEPGTFRLTTAGENSKASIVVRPAERTPWGRFTLSKDRPMATIDLDDVNGDMPAKLFIFPPLGAASKLKLTQFPEKDPELDRLWQAYLEGIRAKIPADKQADLQHLQSPAMREAWLAQLVVYRSQSIRAALRNPKLQKQEAAGKDMQLISQGRKIAWDSLAQRDPVIAAALRDVFRDYSVPRIDPDTVIAYQRLGAAFYRAIDRKEDADDIGLPGFVLGSFPRTKLPQVAAPFGLDVSMARIGDAELKELASLKNLAWLRVKNCQVTDAGFKELERLENLATLDVRETKITGKGLRELAGLKNLRTIYLDEKTTDADLAQLSALRGLTALELSRAKISPAGWKALADLDNLVSLDLAGTPLTAAGAKELTRLRNLTTLNLAGTPLTDEVLRELTGCRKLTNLNLEFTEITDASLAEIVAMKHLTTLKLWSCGKLTDDGLKHLAQFEGLTSLKLGSFLRDQQVTDATAKNLARLTRLTDLTLFGTRVTDAGLKDLAPLKNLTMLNLWGTQVTDGGLKHLAGFRELRSLDLGGTRVTDAGLADLASCKHLGKLYLSNTGVTDAGLARLNDLPCLRTLYLVQTKVSDAGLRNLAALRSLTHVELTRTTVTFAGLGALREALPHCYIGYSGQ